MEIKQIGPAKILRPSIEEAGPLKATARDHLLSEFRPGVYTGKDVSKLAQHQYNFYERYILETLPHLASRDATEFFLSQYDESAKILHGQKLEDKDEWTEWQLIEGNFRRAIKYIVELMCIQEPPDTARAPEPVLPHLTGSILSAAEQMANLVEMSERSHSVFLDDCSATVYFESDHRDYTIELSRTHGDFDLGLLERLKRDRNSRERFAGKIQFDMSINDHANHLDAAFSESFDIGYGDFIAILTETIKESRPAPNGFSTLFIKKSRLIKEIARASGYPTDSIDIALSGFTLTPHKLRTEKRALWNPKQKHRALCRGFFSFPHSTGEHLAFSSALANENLHHLVNRVCYQQLPHEWITLSTEKACRKLAREAGVWFEETVNLNLRNVGLRGGRAKDSIGNKKLKIPSKVGEIDFLGYNSQGNTLVLIESKMVFTGLEARFWRDDLFKFIRSKKSYASKFINKIEWVRQHQSEIRSALNLPAGSEIKTAMLTLYPCIVELFIEEFPCVSLTEFMLDWEEQCGWPYN